MPLSRKDFEVLADHINQWLEEQRLAEADEDVEWWSYLGGVRDLLDTMCDGLKKVNPRFDANKFIERCLK